MKAIKDQIDEQIKRDREIIENFIPQEIKNALLKEKIGQEFWKWCSTGTKSYNICLDLTINRGLELAEKLLQHDGIIVKISTLIKEDNYLELEISYSEFN